MLGGGLLGCPLIGWDAYIIEFYVRHGESNSYLLGDTFDIKVFDLDRSGTGEKGAGGCHVWWSMESEKNTMEGAETKRAREDL
jgi:hypothetical protein